MQIEIDKTETVDLTEKEEKIYTEGFNVGFARASVLWLFGIAVIILVLILT